MEDKLINFDELLKLFKRKWWIVIVITAILTSLAVYKVSKLQPSYQATAKVFISKGENYMGYYSKQEMEYYSNLLSVFSEIVKIDDFLTNTLKTHKIDKSPSMIKNGLSFSGAANSPIFTISYYSWQEDEMKEILDAVCVEFCNQIKEIMPETNPKIIDTPKVSTIYPNKKKLPIMAFGVGIIVSIGLILVIDYFDDKIRSREALKKVLPIPVLGEIPSYNRGFGKEVKNVRSKQGTEFNSSRSV